MSKRPTAKKRKRWSTVVGAFVLAVLAPVTAFLLVGNYNLEKSVVSTIFKRDSDNSNQMEAASNRKNSGSTSEEKEARTREETVGQMDQFPIATKHTPLVPTMTSSTESSALKDSTTKRTQSETLESLIPPPAVDSKEDVIALSPAQRKPNLKENTITESGALAGKFTWNFPPDGMVEHQHSNEEHWVEKNEIQIAGDFFIDFTALAPKQFSGFGILLKGKADGRDLKLNFNCDNMFSDGFKYRVSTPKGEIKFQPTRGSERQYRLQRVGKVFVLTCDSCRVMGKHVGGVKIAQFISKEHRSFCGIRLGVDTSSSISEVRFGPVLE